MNLIPESSDEDGGGFSVEGVSPPRVFEDNSGSM